jgi:glycosyltransferase involved in cell wall biosynthesis
VRVLQVTNMVSHHQLPIAKYLLSILGEENFRFAATKQLDAERQKLGWNLEQQEPWILRPGMNETDRQPFEEWWDNADVVLCGDRMFERMMDRTSRGKATFHMSERWWKAPIGRARLLHPRFLRMSLNFRRLGTSPHFHYLSIGEHSGSDAREVAGRNLQVRRWGYFTALPAEVSPSTRPDDQLSVLWVGRMLAWKRVDTLIKAFQQLVSRQPSARLTLVGEGAECDALKSLATRILPEGSHTFQPAQPAPAILKLMQQHRIYVLPSTGQEGWGAVVNEAMSAGCAVVATRQTGAASSLIADGVNGLTFDAGNWKELADRLCALSEDRELLSRLSREGKTTVATTWSPAVAGERFLQVCEGLLSGSRVPDFTTGPMTIIPG